MVKCRMRSEEGVAVPLHSIRRKKVPISIAEGCPGLPRQWTPAEINSALSTTSFSVAFGPSQVLPAAVGLAAAIAGFAVSTSQNNEAPNNEAPTFSPAQPNSP